MPLGDVILPAPASPGFSLLRHSFELAISLVFALVALAWALDPAGVSSRSTIGHEFGWWQGAWSCFYFAALPLVWAGVFRRWNNIRCVGLILLAVGLAMQGTASLAVKPFEPRDFAFYVYSVAAGLRAAYLYLIGERR